MRYLHGNQVDEVLAQEDGNGDVVWLLRDYLGTIRDLLDNTGDVVNHLTYDSYGNVVSETNSTVDSRYSFTGREWDEEIELYYYRARYYSGETGRFISVDPISFDSDTYNLYGYVDNNPVSNVDPSGLILQKLIPLASTFAIADGPLPIGDLIGLGFIVVGTTIYYVQVSNQTNTNVNSCSATSSLNPPGDCTPSEHFRLQKDVDKKCSTSRKCTVNDTPQQIHQKIGLIAECLKARVKINRKCFKGGDQTHRDQEQQEVNAMTKCYKQLK
nr:RHS repeat-associated core domain-containing protein [Cyanobacterium aponinum]